MKSIKLLLLSIVLLFSNLIIAQTEIRGDFSLSKEEENDLAIIAWDGVKFGITKQETLKTKPFRGGKIIKGKEVKFPIDEVRMSWEKESEYRTMMDLESYPHITASFGGLKSDELVQVEIDLNASMSVNGYNTLKRDALKIIKILKKTYGNKANFTISESKEKTILREVEKGSFYSESIGSFECGYPLGDNYIKEVYMLFKKYAPVTDDDKQLQLQVLIINEKYPLIKWMPSYDDAKAQIEREKEKVGKQRNLF